MSDGFDEGVLCVFPTKAVVGGSEIDCWASAIHDVLLNHKITTMLMKICCMSVHIKRPRCIFNKKNVFFFHQPAFIPHTHSSFLHLIVKAKCSGRVLTVISEGGFSKAIGFVRLKAVIQRDPELAVLEETRFSRVGGNSIKKGDSHSQRNCSGWCGGGKVSWGFKTHSSNVVFNVKSLCILTRCLLFKHGSLTQNRNF